MKRLLLVLVGIIALMSSVEAQKKFKKTDIDSTSFDIYVVDGVATITESFYLSNGDVWTNTKSPTTEEATYQLQKKRLREINIEGENLLRNKDQLLEAIEVIKKEIQVLLAEKREIRADLLGEEDPE